MLKIYVDYNSRDLSDPGKEYIILPVRMQHLVGQGVELIEGERVVIYDEDISYEALLRRRKSELSIEDTTWMAEIIPGTLEENLAETPQAARL